MEQCLACPSPCRLARCRSFAVHRSLIGRPFLGFVGGLGAATAQGLFATLAIGGADLVASILVDWRLPVHLVSAAILIALGVRTLRKKAPQQGAQPAASHHAAYLSGLMLALSNPMTILPYVAITSVSSAQTIAPVGRTFLMVPGVILGATCWYAVLSSAAATLRHGIARAVIPHLNIGAGIAPHQLRIGHRSELIASEVRKRDWTRWTV